MNRMLKKLMGFLAGFLLITACGPAVQTRTSGVTLSPNLPAARAAVSSTAPAAACTSPAALTIAETEGPYFKANSPERSSLLEAGMPGKKLVLSGRVLTGECQPVKGALLDFWQANADGQYDNSGYTLRGHQYTDAAGAYRLTTIIPGLYPGRTEHIHVKVQAPGGPLLTTQLFFPGVTNNDGDGFFDPSLLIALQPAADGALGTYNFIVGTK